MKGLYKCLSMLALLTFSTTVYSGQLLYRDGQGGQSCSVSSTTGTYGSITKLLTCNGKAISRYIRECSVRGGCWSKYEPISNEVDFNYNLPGMVDQKEFGSISTKSQSNVFAARENSQNYIAYSDDGILDKPVIFVEGFDPNNETFPDFYYRYNGISNLVFGGRDLFIIDFSDGAKDLAANAELLKNIINEINSAKSGSHPTAVVGYSMGGIIARKALKNMESQGIDHQTSLYVSFDSPHMGANLPSAISETIGGLVARLDSHTAGYTASELKRAQKVYKSDAAKQMLIGSGYLVPATFADFPEKLTRVGITSGNLLGKNGMQTNSVVENEFIASFRFYLYYSSGGVALPSSSLSKSFEWYTNRINNVFYDNVPGSYENIFRESYLKLKDGADKFEEWNAPRNSNITFVPTFSSLAMKASSTETLIDNVKYDSPFDRYIAVNPIGGIDACSAFDLQMSVGENIPHNPGYSYFNSNQMAQLHCAMIQYHSPNSKIPSRFLKMGRSLSTALLMIPINNILLN